MLPAWLADPTIQFLITGVVTVLGVGATVGLGLHSLTKQHRSTLRLQEAHLRHELEVSLFREISAQLSAAGAALEATMRMVQKAVRSFEAQEEGRGLVELTQAEINRVHYTALDELSRLIALLEQYEIVFYRFRSARNELDQEYKRILFGATDFFRAAGLYFPFDGGPAPHPFRPDAIALAAIRGTAGAYVEACDNFRSFIMDLQVEAQNTLLSELFGRTVPPRNPLDPEVRVLRPDPDGPWLERPPGRFI